MTVYYLLDTNIVSEPCRAEPSRRVLEQMARVDGQMYIASVVLHELIYGIERLAASKKRDIFELYVNDVVLPTFPVLPYDAQAASWHARERARLQNCGRTPAFADGQIAAIAATKNLVLVTRNVRDFTDFRGLSIENWFEAD